MRWCLVAMALVLTAAPTAHAGPDDAARGGAASVLAPTSEWPSEIFEQPGDGIADDGQNDRAILATTAQVQPARTVTAQYDYTKVFSFLGSTESFRAGFVGVKVGVTGRLQLSLTTAVPRDVPLLVAPGFKYQLVRRDRFQVAVHGLYAAFSDDSAPTLAIHGAVVSRCLDRTCGTLISANVSHRTQAQRGVGGGALVVETSLLFPVMKHVKLVAELQLLSLELSSLHKSENSGIGRYGVRFHGWNTAATISVEKPLDTLGADPDAVWLTGSARY